MNRWTDIGGIQARMKREWDSGRLLSVHGKRKTPFPFRLPLRHPTPIELGRQFAEAGDWCNELILHSKAGKGKYYRLETHEVNHRQLGKNRVPVAAVFENETDALLFIRKKTEADTFLERYRQTIELFPELSEWLDKKPLLVLDNAEAWPKLLSVIKWIKENPAPNIFIRQLEIAGVDTKFIERYKKLLGELLDIVLPPDDVREKAKGAAGFETRYGFLAKPPQIRFRLLDPLLFIQGLSDLQLTAAEFSSLYIHAETIFITENDINGLAFPNYKNSMVIFGLGYGLEVLAKAAWLKDRKIFYWGDIDTHGFAMLNQVRHYFPHARSFLMDRSTLMVHRPLWGKETVPVNRELTRLNSDEKALYDDLRYNRIAEALRMEQERVSYTHFKSALIRDATAVSACPSPA